MGMLAPLTDLTRRLEAMEQHLREARLVAKVHTEARSYILGAPEVGDVLVMAASALDGSYGLEPVESKQLIGYKAVALGTGTLTAKLDYHDTPNNVNINIVTGYAVPVGTVASLDQQAVTPALDVADGDLFTLTVTAVTGAPSVLSFTPVLLVRR